MDKHPVGRLSHLRDRTTRAPSITTLHVRKLRTLERQAEEYVLASIKHPHLPRLLQSLVCCWISDFFSLVFRYQVRKTPSVQSTSESMDRRVRLSWKTVCSIFCLEALILFAKPFKWLGHTVENWLNIFNANGGLRQTLRKHIFTRDALERPCQEDDHYFSLVGLLDVRQDLWLQQDGRNDVPTVLDSNDSIKLAADLCIMASKLAYENGKVIERVVNQQWKMNFVRYYNCWNEYLESNSTQAFVFTDKVEEANAVVLAFRGTEPFNMFDWSTDFDFSYYVLPKIGRVHVGFLEALGLGNRLQTETLKQVKINSSMKASGESPVGTPTSGLPHQVLDDNKKVLAYDAICAEVRALLRENLGAKLYITGHSLGGALASLFTALLLYERDPILESVAGVFTFGQPRVGDGTFATYMQEHLCTRGRRKYFRVVFRNDIVTRVPFDDNLLQFKHIGPCYYFSSISKGKVLQEQPYKNVFFLILNPIFHLYAIMDLIRSIIKILSHRAGAETKLGLLMRFVALLTPGICAHSPTHYVDAIRTAPATFLQLPSS